MSQDDVFEIDVQGVGPGQNDLYEQRLEFFSGSLSIEEQWMGDHPPRTASTSIQLSEVQALGLAAELLGYAADRLQERLHPPLTTLEDIYGPPDPLD